MNTDDVAIQVEHNSTSTKPNEPAGVQVQIKPKRKGRRWILLSLILTLCLVTVIALKAVCRSKSGGIVYKCDYNCQPCSDSSGGPCPDICQESHYSEYCSSLCEAYESHWFIPLVVVFSVLYLLECFLCYEWASQHKMDLNSFREYMTKLKSTPPEIIVSFECYHYYKTGRYVPNGRGVTPQIEKHVSKTGSESFPFSSWEDNTEDIVQTEDNWQRIHICPVIKFKDRETRECLESFKKKVKKDNNTDMYFSMKTKYKIPEYIGRVLVSKETDAQAPYCVNGVVFWFWSLLLLTWPYRVYLEIVARLKILKVIKVVKKSAEPWYFS